MPLETVAILGQGNDWKRKQARFCGPAYVLFLDLETD